MKQLAALSRNLAAIESNGKLVASVEVVVDVIEPTLSLDPLGSTRRTRAETYRFWCDPSGLRQLAEQATQWADEAEKLLSERSE